jgi:hypothetical protein
MRDTIKARLIFEAQGKPKNQLEDSMKELVERIKTFGGAEVFDVKHEPAIVFKGTDMFSALSDVGIETEKFSTLFGLVLTFGPSAIIVLEPDKFEVQISELQLALNDLSHILHGMANETLASRLQLTQHLQKKKTK